MRNPSKIDQWQKERGYPLSLSSWAGWVLQDGAHLDSSRESRQRGEQAGQAESLPAAVCVDAPLASCMAWHPGIIDTFFLSPSVSLPFSKVVVDGCTSGTRAVERVASFLPDRPAANIKPVCPLRRVSSPNSQPSTSHFRERHTQYFVGFIHSPATLDWRASDAEQEGWGDTRLFPPSFSLSSR